MQLSDDIHNLVEKLLIAELTENKPNISEAMLPDLCCLVLNKVPPRYVRHDVDTAFYTPDPEWEQLEKKIRAAIKESEAFLNSKKLRY